MINKFSDIDRLSPDDFERFVMEVFIAAGWKNARLTKVGQEYKHGDGGIDIFAQKNDVKYAIEVKQRSHEIHVDIKSLNQLITGAELTNIKNRILVTNSFFTSEVVARALKLGVELIDRNALHDLYIEKRTEIGRSSIKPRKYQLEIINDCLISFANGKRRLLIEMATGLGKTYTSALLIKEILKQYNQCKRVLFLVHQVEIVMQTVTAYKNIFGIGHFTFSVCFDGKMPDNSDFVFATFDTFYIHLDSIDKNIFDVVIVDEAHHSPAKTYHKIIEHLHPKFLVGMTATPYREDGKNVYDIFGGEDGVIGKYDLVWALKHNKLAFPKYYVLLNDLDEKRLDELKKGFQISDIDQRLFLNKKDNELISTINRIILEQRIASPKAIVFCRSIVHIKHLIKYFEPGTATFVHSRQNQIERRTNISLFRDGNAKFILVCDLFNEGIDIPETNMLIFLRSTASKRIWMQQLGRGLRKTTNKEFVHVLDFVGSIGRINEIKQLQKNIRDCPLDPEQREPRQEREIDYCDNSIDVHFDQHAAQVLTLLEENQYKLSTRSRAIELLREYYTASGTIPALNEIEKVLANITPDQISTLFGTYISFIQCAIPSANIETIADISDMKEFINRFRFENNITPLAETVSSHFKYDGLYLASSNEIKFLFPSIFSVENLEIKNTASIAGTKVEMNQIESDSLFRLYEDRIYFRSDLMQLSEHERVKIRSRFKSELLFLKRLNDFRHNNKI